MQIKRALLSVSDKTSIVELAKFLQSKEVEIISTGGTAKVLKENDIQITPIENITGNPEAFGGRMKTISFQVGSGILFRRDNSDDLEDMQNLDINPIDLVVCNLYPFEEVSKTSKELNTLIENIDIGGPTMIRAAAKNYKFVSVLSNPNQYNDFINNFDTQTEQDRLNLSIEAIKMTAHYDQFIYNTLTTNQEIPAPPLAFQKLEELRYGENPHQKAWLAKWKNTYHDVSLAEAKQLHGKALSYNNLVDADAAWKCTSELNLVYSDKAITTIVKHANPCGVCVGSTSVESLQNAWDCDPVSSFGSIISYNKEVDEQYALWLSDKFVEIVIAPSFDAKAIEIFQKKKNIRLIECENKPENSVERVIKSINGGLLIQEEDELQKYEFLTVTSEVIPTNFSKLKHFGMICNKYLKSNSISLVGYKNSTMVLAGGGMGQPNRLDSLKMLAGPRAKHLGHQLNELILISDAFFPFRDSIDAANELGIKYIIQPGGSIRDEEVITACNEHKIAMDFTKTRHFRH